jgi:hypothetical protein
MSNALPGAAMLSFEMLSRIVAFNRKSINLQLLVKFFGALRGYVGCG